MTKIKENIRIIFRKNEEDVKVKVKWSLKKKLLVGLGILGTGALGIFAYGKKSAEDVEHDSDFEDENEDFDEDYPTEDSDEDNISNDEVEAQA